MSDIEHETLDGIVADVRKRADCAESHGEGVTHNDGVAALLRSIAQRIMAATLRERKAWISACRAAIKNGRENQHPYADFFGCAGVATVHHYEVRATVAGRCDLMATFTDLKRAMEYAEHLARELADSRYDEEEGEE